MWWQVQDLDRKVRRGRERLAQDLDASNLVPISTEKSDQLVNIEESIKKFLEEIETFGEEGKVDEAEALMKKVMSMCSVLILSLSHVSFHEDISSFQPDVRRLQPHKWFGASCEFQWTFYDTLITKIK